MIILENAAGKIKEFNNYPDWSHESYHRVLTAREVRRSFVNENGNIMDNHLYLIDRALRSYFMMNRGNRMGRTEEFVNKLGNSLRDNETRNILANLRDVSITAPLQNYKSGRSVGSRKVSGVRGRSVGSGFVNSVLTWIVI